MEGYRVTWKNYFSIVLVVVTFGLVLTACGGSGGGGGNETTDAANDSTPVTVQKGVFLDSAVEGVTSKTATQSGLTDSDGTFNYVAGEIVSFFIGDILLGSATGKVVLTPIDLVPGAVDEMNPQVTNIIRFLQTLDADNNLSNGIQITTAVLNLAAGRTINFNVSILAFENDGNVQTIVADLTTVLGAPRSLIPAATAQSHLRDTLGGGSAGEFGSLSITGPITDVIGTVFNPDFNSRVDVGTPGTGLLTWSNDGGNVLTLTKDMLIVGMVGGEIFSITFRSSTATGSGVSLVVSRVDYSLDCGAGISAPDTPECNKIAIDQTAKTISFNNVQFPLTSISSGININTGPINLKGTLTWQ